MDLNYFVVKVNEKVYLKKSVFNSGWYATHNLKDAEPFISRNQADNLAHQWGGKVVRCAVDIRTCEEDE